MISSLFNDNSERQRLNNGTKAQRQQQLQHDILTCGNDTTFLLALDRYFQALDLIERLSYPIND